MCAGTILIIPIRRYAFPVDFLLRVHNQWKEIRPELNTDPFLSVGRILRIASFVIAISEEIVQEHGLTRGEFELMGAVRRSGKNCRATELSVMTQSSGAAITKRLDKLSASGLITREILPRDRRVVLVNLTERGREVIDELMPIVLDSERKILSQLADTEVKELQQLTEKLMNVVEPSKR